LLFIQILWGAERRKHSEAYAVDPPLIQRAICGMAACGGKKNEFHKETKVFSSNFRSMVFE
jgi:hypothetical protein